MTQRALSALQGWVVGDRSRSLVGVDLDPRRSVTPDHRPNQLTIGKTCNALVSVTVVKIHKERHISTVGLVPGPVHNPKRRFDSVQMVIAGSIPAQWAFYSRVAQR
jgi:hypothetical protein